MLHQCYSIDFCSQAKCKDLTVQRQMHHLARFKAHVLCFIQLLLPDVFLIS